MYDDDYTPIFQHFCPQCGETVNLEELTATTGAIFIETGLCAQCQEKVSGHQEG